MGDLLAIGIQAKFTVINDLQHDRILIFNIFGDIKAEWWIAAFMTADLHAVHEDNAFHIHSFKIQPGAEGIWTVGKLTAVPYCLGPVPAVPHFR